MSSVLAVFDGLGWHAIWNLELVMLWQSLICYQQKHLWLIGHIRTVVHTHTHTGVLCFCLRYACMLITHYLRSLTNVYHILSRMQTRYKDALKGFARAYTYRHMKTRPSDVVCCELVLRGLERGPRKELELCCGFTRVSVMTFINDWVAVEASLAKHPDTCVCL